MKDEKLPTYTFDKVSDWFDTDSFKVFVKVVNSGDVLELRSTKCSHWGVTTRIPQPPISPKSKAKPRKQILGTIVNMLSVKEVGNQKTCLSSPVQFIHGMNRRASESLSSPLEHILFLT